MHINKLMCIYAYSRQLGKYIKRKLCIRVHCYYFGIYPSFYISCYTELLFGS